MTMDGAVLTMMVVTVMTMMVTMATGELQHIPLTSRDIDIILSRGDNSDMIKVDGDCVLTPRNFTSSGMIVWGISLTLHCCVQEAAVSAR